MPELTEADVSVLRMMAGANFIGGSITLPSGRVLEADEMQALTSFYAKPYEKGSEMNEPREDWDMNKDQGSSWAGEYEPWKDTKRENSIINKVKKIIKKERGSK